MSRPFELNVQLENCRIRNRRLYYSIPGGNEEQSIVVPFGAGVDCARFVFRLQAQEIFAVPIGGAELSTRISPSFSVEDSVRYPKNAEENPYSIVGSSCGIWIDSSHGS